MNFADVDRRFQELKSQFDANQIGADEFTAALGELMVQDDQGRWWTKSADTGGWMVHDEAAGAWVAGQPPAPRSYQPAQQSYQAPAQAYQPQQGYQPAAQPYQPAYQPAPQGYAAPAYAMPAAPAMAAPVAGSKPVSSGVALLLYLVSFLFPIAGVVVFFVYRGRPYPEDKQVAKLSLILAVVGFVVGFACTAYMGY